MNQVVLTGRLTRDPEKRYSASNIAITKFTIAVDRMARQGEERKADFIRIVVFDKQAENCDRYLQKGKKVAVVGRIQTGSYENQQGQRVYTTDVVANNVEFLEWGEANDRPQVSGGNEDFMQNTQEASESDQSDKIPQGLQPYEESMPF